MPALGLAALILGGLSGGVFTPTEASGVGFALALALVVAQRRLPWAAFKDAVTESMLTTVTILLILAGAAVFGRTITLYRIPQEISAAIAATFDRAAPFILVVSLVLLLMGCFLEALSMLLIMMPVLDASLAVLGIDPIL